MARVGIVVGSASLVLIGMVAGAALQPIIVAQVRQAVYNQQRRAEEGLARARDPQQWREDSARLAQWQLRARLDNGRGPREIRRVQASTTCAVSFEFRDTAWRHLPLFHVRAWDRMEPGVVIAEGWAYRELGFATGDTVTVVLPNIACGHLLIGGYGASIASPPPPLQLEVP